jgi:hypothetical protein
MAALTDSAAAKAYKARWQAAHPGKKWTFKTYLGRIAKARSAAAVDKRGAGYADRTNAALAGTRAKTLVKTKTVNDRTVGPEGSESEKAAIAAWIEARKDQPSQGSDADAADFTKFVGEGGGWKGVAKEVPNVNAQARDFRKNVKGSKFSDWEDRVARATKAEAAGTKSAGYADRTRAQLAAGKVKGALPSQLKKVATKRAEVVKPAAVVVKPMAANRVDAAADWSKNHGGKKATTAQINAVVNARAKKYPPAK